METKQIAWQTGSGNITLTYQGQGDVTVTVESDENYGAARSQVITIETTKGSPVVTRNLTVSQVACPFPVGDINNYNTYLHELLYHIGEDFLEEVHIDNKINGVITRETKLRYQLIYSHSARRSFATINTMRNIPRNKILRATGHSSEKAFNRYICYDDEG